MLSLNDESIKKPPYLFSRKNYFPLGIVAPMNYLHVYVQLDDYVLQVFIHLKCNLETWNAFSQRVYMLSHFQCCCQTQN